MLKRPVKQGPCPCLGIQSRMDTDGYNDSVDIILDMIRRGEKRSTKEKSREGQSSLLRETLEPPLASTDPLSPF